jgi:6-phosphogluconolactonase
LKFRTLAFVCSSPEDQPATACISTLAFDEAEGTFTRLAEMPHTDNPTFVALDPTNDRVFVAGETLQSTVTSYRLDPDSGRLDFISVRPTGGQFAAHVAIDARGRTLFVANYSTETRDPSSTGAVAFGIDDEGTLSTALWNAAFSGSGPVRMRQDSTHPHSTLLSPDQRLLLVQDLGLDRLFCFDFDAATQALRPATPSEIRLPPGAGPRHALFSADGAYLYVVHELSSAVSVIDMRADREVVQTIGTLPPDLVIGSFCADIQMTADGEWLFVSNRGHNSISCFRVERASGRLHLVDQTSVEGDWPRSFALDPSDRFLVVANQRSHELVVFALDAATGALVQTGTRLKIAQPMCVKFARFAVATT